MREDFFWRRKNKIEKGIFVLSMKIESITTGGLTFDMGMRLGYHHQMGGLEASQRERDMVGVRDQRGLNVSCELVGAETITRVVVPV